MVSTNSRRALVLLGLALCAFATFALWNGPAVEPPAPHTGPDDTAAVVAPAAPTGAHPSTTLDPGLPLATEPETAVSDTATLVVTGRARTHAGAGVSDAELVLARTAEPGAGERTLARATSASDGRFRFELPASDVLDAPGAELVLRASAPGYQPARERRVLADVWARAGGARAYEWTLLVLPGQVLRGRTVDAA